VIELGVADLVIIAARTLGLDTGQVLDLLDPSAAERALDHARPGSDPADAGRAADAAGQAAVADAGGRAAVADAAGQAAALLHALVRHRPLRNGNQQVALVAMLQFLALNGWEVDLGPPAPVRAMVAELAADAIVTKDVAGWLAPRLRPTQPAAPAAKEAPMRPRQMLPLAERIKRAATRTQRKGLFQRLTDRARRSMALAQDEARLLRHNYIGTEHLLLGLLHEGDGVAARALESMGISLDGARGQVKEIIGRGNDSPAGHIPYTPRAKKVLELSLREALQLGHHYVGTEHVLLGLLREGQGVAAQVLTRLGAEHAQVREHILGLLAGECKQAGSDTLLVRLAVPDELLDAADQLADVRQQKEAALDAGDFERAAALRDRESQLLADKLRLEGYLTGGVDIDAVITDNQRAHREIDRLRGLLRQHGIEPDGGTARTA